MIFEIKKIENKIWIVQRDKKVKSAASMSGAKKVIKFLTSGGAFNGEIPTFMLTQT